VPPKIKDRFDLTLECIRRHYLGQPSPLNDTLVRSANFFDLFDEFAGYVTFFYLQDLVDNAASAGRFSILFAAFDASPLPQTLEQYLACRSLGIAFIHAGNGGSRLTSPRLISSNLASDRTTISLWRSPRICRRTARLTIARDPTPCHRLHLGQPPGYLGPC
jgi:hypothetical protein